MDVNFPDFGRVVSLPTSILFKARNDERAENVETDIFFLDGAKIGTDLSVVLTDGCQLDDELAMGLPLADQFKEAPNGSRIALTRQS
jgi:hypothetical protein